MSGESPAERGRRLVEAASRRVSALTPEQLERRRRLAEHQRLIQGGIVRGPNAPKDGTFGKTA